jgi:hypothetical protein
MLSATDRQADGGVKKGYTKEASPSGLANSDYSPTQSSNIGDVKWHVEAINTAPATTFSSRYPHSISDHLQQLLMKTDKSALHSRVNPYRRLATDHLAISLPSLCYHQAAAPQFHK